MPVQAGIKFYSVLPGSPPSPGRHLDSGSRFAYPEPRDLQGYDVN
jgi:hypothetical protein